MSAILFAPHADDETLFAFYQVLRHRPKVIIVLSSMREELQGGPTQATRLHETGLAMAVAGVEWEQWPWTDDKPDWTGVRLDMLKAAHNKTLIIGPCWEQGGHEDHNVIATMVDLLGADMRVDVIRYMTYKRGHGRTESPNEVVPTAEERILKTVALACYQSQKDWPPTAPWFDPADQREFLA